MGRAHTKNNTLRDDATYTGRSSVNTTPVSTLCSATCTEWDSDGIDVSYSAQLNASDATDGQVDIGTVPADRLDESRDGVDATTGRNGSEFDDE